MKDSESLFSKVIDIFGEDLLQNIVIPEANSNDSVLSLSL